MAWLKTVAAPPMTFSGRSARACASFPLASSLARQHFLYFCPLPQKHSSFRPSVILLYRKPGERSQIPHVIDKLGLPARPAASGESGKSGEAQATETRDWRRRGGPRVSAQLYETLSERLGRLVGFEPTTSRTTIWRYYQLSYSRRVLLSVTRLSSTAHRRERARRPACGSRLARAA